MQRYVVYDSASKQRWLNYHNQQESAAFIGLFHVASSVLPPVESYRNYQKPTQRGVHNNNNNIIIINLFIEGSLISAKALFCLFCLRALFGATRIHSYTRMASLIRTRLRDLCTRREEGISARKPLGTAVPQDENLPTGVQGYLSALQRRV